MHYVRWQRHGDPLFIQIAPKGTGHVDSNGYRRIGGKHARHAEHRIVAEAKIGRALLPGEIVHHVNGDRLDNRPENLEVMTASEHCRLHARLSAPFQSATHKECGRCHQVKPRSMFTPCHHPNFDPHQSWCRDCYNRWQRERRRIRRAARMSGGHLL